jgi:hypothetical protein
VTGARLGRCFDRRTFLRRIAVLGVGGSSASLLACGGGDTRSGSGVEELAPLEPISHPLLLPWSDDVIRIAAPISELPVAYVAMAAHRVYIDREYRDRASWLLNAHISVSTALWRIPLPGDPAGLPVTPGDELREFEEVSIREWDPALPPAEDDVRIRRGRRATTTVHFSCVPGDGAGGATEGNEWFSAGPWPIDVCVGGPEETTREDFMRAGSGFRHVSPGCEDQGQPVGFITWACREIESTA